MDDLKLGILGCGAVGSAIRDVHLSIGQKVVVHDLNLGTELSCLLEADVIFVCLPTPQSSTGECDLTIVEGELKKLDELDYNGIVVMKSTVPPGTGNIFSKRYKFDYVSCPEFLREHSAIDDYRNQKVHFVGFDCDPSRVKSILKPLGSDIKEVSLTEAELIKYFHNTFNAWRIIFANAFCELSEKLDANYENILKNVCLLNDYSDKYLKSSDDFKGFGGPCLPKDTAALASVANQLELRSNIWQFCIEENDKWETKLVQGLRERGFQSLI